MHPHPDHHQLPPTDASTAPSSHSQDVASRQPPESGRKRRQTDGERDEAGRGDPLPPSEAPGSTVSMIDEPFKVRKERLIDAFERRYLRELMSWAGGNVSRAARKAQIDRMYLHRLLARHGIVREPPRDPEQT